MGANYNQYPIKMGDKVRVLADQVIVKEILGSRWTSKKKDTLGVSFDIKRSPSSLDTLCVIS